jgi:hypothetical protein
MMSKKVGPEKNLLYRSVFFYQKQSLKIQIGLLTANQQTQTLLNLTVFLYSCMHSLTVFAGVDAVVFVILKQTRIRFVL